MDYVKVIKNGYILAIGSGIENSVPITKEEYNTILSVIRAKPKAVGTTDYRLREDLTWEAYEIEPPDPDHDIDDAELAAKAEAYDILIGGAP